jgi:hypothetical protein
LAYKVLWQELIDFCDIQFSTRADSLLDPPSTGWPDRMIHQAWDPSHNGHAKN